MPIKTGYYKMRSGGHAKIEIAPQDCTGIYPIQGKIGDEPHRWCKDGRYSAYPEDHEFDLMEAIETPETAKQHGYTNLVYHQ